MFIFLGGKVFRIVLFEEKSRLEIFVLGKIDWTFLIGEKQMKLWKMSIRENRVVDLTFDIDR